MGVGQATPIGAVTQANGDAGCAAEGRDVISSSRPGGRAAPLRLQSIQRLLFLLV